MILVDRCRGWGEKGAWCHMVSDKGLDELHAFAEEIGIKKCWFERDHYDLRIGMRSLAIDKGAREVSNTDLVRRMTPRRPKRRSPRRPS